MASFDMTLQHLRNSGSVALYERLKTSLSGLGYAALQFADDASDRISRRVDFVGWPELPEKSTGRVDQLVRVIAWDMEERAAERSTSTGKIEKGYSALVVPHWSPFGAFPFECPSEEDAATTLEMLIALRYEVDRSRARIRLKAAFQRAQKEAARLRAMIEPIERFENMMRRGFCPDCPNEPL